MKKDKKAKSSTPKKSLRKTDALVTAPLVVEEDSLLGALLEENYLKIKSSPKVSKTIPVKKNS